MQHPHLGQGSQLLAGVTLNLWTGSHRSTSSCRGWRRRRRGKAVLVLCLRPVSCRWQAAIN